MQAVSQVVGKFEAVATRADNNGACLVTGMAGFNKKTLVVDFYVCDTLIKMIIDMLVGVRLCLAHK